MKLPSSETRNITEEFSWSANTSLASQEVPYIYGTETLTNVLTRSQNCLSRSSKSYPSLSRFRLFEMETAIPPTSA